MGVTGLWSIVQPCARPIKLDTLNRKRLAVDASIWIYQFLKAVRDKEGNALRNSHVVGFFRRICKLLFFGIKPVFVFDGGAPALKRQTITNRKRRREGRRDDAVRTAGKLLAVQMQRRAEEEEQKRRDRQKHDEEPIPDEDLVYVDELQMSHQERQQNRKFRKKDAYHLPDLDVSLTEMGGPNDPRIMSIEELEAYARQFDTGEDINVYDFSKIDYDSPFFTSLPASDRYNILNAARLRSRLRMGHSKEQLDSMFPDRMAFSHFQIERVQERNDLTQRLMNINGFGGDSSLDSSGRVAGEKGREYVLVKNDGVEGGWALGVISDEGTKQENAIDVDKPRAPAMHRDSESEGEDFEDVPIEGLNRLPKRRKLDLPVNGSLSKQRRAYYQSRRQSVKPRREDATQAEDLDSLFMMSGDIADEAGEVGAEADHVAEEVEEDDEELRRAIAMSLEKNHTSSPLHEHQPDLDIEEEDDMREIFQQSAVKEAQPVPTGSARAIANILNKRAFHTAPESHEVTSFGVPVPVSRGNSHLEVNEDDEDEEDGVDLQAALVQSLRDKRKLMPPQQHRVESNLTIQDTAEAVTQKAGLFGPLPFEKLDLGSSLLGAKKMQQRTEEAAGGFEKPGITDKEREKKRKAEPLPPWFSGNLNEDIQKQRAIESEDRQQAKEFSKQFQFQSREEPRLRRQETGEVIDLAADEPKEPSGRGEVIDLESDEAAQPTENVMTMSEAPHVVASNIGEHEAEPPLRSYKYSPLEADTNNDTYEAFRDSTTERQDKQASEIEWSESDAEFPPRTESEAGPAKARMQEFLSRSPSMEFEDALAADISELPAGEQANGLSPHAEERVSVDREREEPNLVEVSGFVNQESVAEDEFDDFSDPEDEELLKQLTLEAEEHARFASSLNNKSLAQNVADYEKELKQLRNQQKKDRRDADEVTHVMITECQQLLRLFGLPYITAPMEAEAQCAELVRLGLVDGIVTDDSDCFLFGGTRVYKNMFNQAKFVECYFTSDFEKEFDLTREKLIQIAQLLGSDYTEGLPGVGPVTALEIISDFSGLEEFKKWFTAVQMNQISADEDKGNALRKTLRKQAAKLFLPQAFPDHRVEAAYQSPEVDSNPEQFQWGVPDLDALRSYLMATIGWSQERTDEVLVPVIRDMNRREDEGTQSNITKFFDGRVGMGATGPSAKGDAFAPRRKIESSKRMGNALGKMADRAKLRRAGRTAEQADDGNGRDKVSSRRKARTAHADGAGGLEDGEDKGEDSSQMQRKGSRRKKRAVESQ